jgi:Carboxypeptidase regulatory-like domain
MSSIVSALRAGSRRFALDITALSVICLCVGLVLVLFPSQAPAQTASTGDISGLTTDPSGGAVAGVRVQATNEATGEVRTITTQADGRYAFPLLPPGSYGLEFSKAGFKLATKSGVQVSVTETTTLNVDLQLGEMEQRTVVTAQTELLQTESAALGRVVDEKGLDSLPLVTRNFTQIVTLSPGIAAEVTNATAAGRGSGGESGGAFRANGAEGIDNNFQMNGTEVNDFMGAFFFSGGVPIPNPDAIQEFKVQTGQYDATYGRNAGANIAIVTKSGTNSYHGDVFEFFRNDVLNANDFFRNEAGQPRGVLKQNQFGFTLGGPVWKDKLLFFTSYQGTRQLNGVDQTVSQSNLFEPAFTNDRSAAAIGQLFAGRCGSLDTSCVLPIAADGSNISAQALALLNLKLPNGQYAIPTPQSINSSAPLEDQGFSSFSIPARFNEDQAVLDIDFLQTERSRFAVRFFLGNSTENQPLPNGLTGLSGTLAPGSPTIVSDRFRDVSLEHTYSFSADLLNQAQFGFHHIGAQAVPTSPFTWSGIGAESSPVDDVSSAISIGGSLAIGDGIGSGYIQNHFLLQDGLTRIHGRHTFRVGGGVNRTLSTQTFFTNADGVSFNSWEDFLLGRAAGPADSGGSGTPPFGNISFIHQALGEFRREWGVWDGNAYFQDDFKVTPNLTLNAGLRYERIGGMGDSLGRNSSWDFSAINPNPPAGGSLDGLVVANNFSGTLPPGVIRSSNDSAVRDLGANSLGPRLGFAWHLPHLRRMALRGGYGIYYSRPAGQTLFQQYINQPYGTVVQLSGSSAGFASLANPFPPNITFPNFLPYSAATQLGFQFNNQDIRPPITQQYSLNIQTDLGHDYLLEVGYVGTRGTHQIWSQDANTALLASPSNPIRGVTTNTVDNIQERVPYEGFNVGFFQDDQSGASSWYNALQVSVTKRFSKGLQFLASYTFSRAYSTWPNDTSAAAASSFPGDQDSVTGYGRSDFNRTHRLVISYLYTLPSPARGFARTALGGWSVAGVTTFQSGLPLTLEGNNENNVYGYTFDRAELAPGCTVGQLTTSGSVTQKLNNYFNLNCIDRANLSAPLSPSNAPAWPVVGNDGIATGYGNLGSGIVFGPAQNNFDMSIIKETPLRLLGESGRIVFRAEFFNAFNTPQFAPPDTFVSDSTFGVISSTAVNPRIIQLSLKLYF